MGSAILGRAFIQAYRQALASKTFFPLYLIAFYLFLSWIPYHQKIKRIKKDCFSVDSRELLSFSLTSFLLIVVIHAAYSFNIRI
jgi:hypothetical protein